MLEQGWGRKPVLMLLEMLLQAGDDGGSDQREHWGRMSGFRKPIEFMTER